MRINYSNDRASQTRLNCETASTREANAMTQTVALYFGFFVALNVIKPIDRLNSSYPQTRWKAAMAGIDLVDEVPKPISDAELQEDVMGTTGYFHPSEILKVITSGSVTSKSVDALKRQILVVAELYGMTSIQRVIVGKTSRVLWIEEVAAEAVVLKAAHDKISTATGAQMKFLRIKKSPLLTELELARYPNLAAACYEVEKLKGMSGATNFKMASHSLSVNIKLIRAYAKRDAKVVSTTEFTALTEYHKKLGIIEKKSSRKRMLESDSSDSDEAPLSTYRRRGSPGPSNQA